MNSKKDAMKILKETSRTFYIPISRLPEGLLEAVSSAYLCMRAIDEIEDHPKLLNRDKEYILRKIAIDLQSLNEGYEKTALIQPFHSEYTLPEVSMRLGEWAKMADPSIAPRIWDATAAMADRMATWAALDFKINTEADLDAYTFSVAGSVGLLLSDLFAWYDGTATNRMHAIGFGRGLQAVNILRNQLEDQDRGVSFMPNGWDRERLFTYTRRNLSLGDMYIESLPKGPVLNFCKIPLVLAHATLEALEKGKEKLSRLDVLSLVHKLTISS